ncbi:MAG: asparagine synthase (glutamine-hydrolyzing) [Calditerrivibrio sp.]|nr:asparagine synthase (glutamine-hydrolyzing) [Calditerrivibrio sp.]
MCGICGFTGKSDLETLKQITDLVSHRGPDDDGYYTDNFINLGVRRLSILDLQSGKQPIHNEDKSLWTVFNGEIYNFQALRQELVEKGHKFYTNHSDTELIVHLFEEYGESFPHKINGMFAIALWDKSLKRLYLIRDRMGVKPLFYCLIGENLIFGSEIKALLAHPHYKKEPNYEALYHYFTFKNIPAPFTAFKDIWSLLPGEMLVWQNGMIEKKRWWRIKFNENYSITELDATKGIIRLLEDATRLRMICDVPFGAYLSGGVDSSTVVALMTRFSDKPIKTFSLGYEDELKNKEADLNYARKVSETFKTEHYEYIMSYRELVNDIENVIYAFDQPFSGTISTYFLTKLISRHVKVALSGDGADELFGSYLSHRLAQPMQRYKEARIRGNVDEADKAGFFAPCDVNFLKELYEKSQGDDVLWRYYLYLFSDEEKNYLISDNFKSNIGSISTLSLLKNSFKVLTAKDALNKILEFEWNTQLPDQVLAFVDFLSMAHSVEIRSPFLDYRLVEFVATIPGEMKIKNGNVKDILKKAVEPLLPHGITKRPKEGFVLPIFDWMVDKLRDYTKDILSYNRLKKHDLLNVNYINELLNQYHSGNKAFAGRVWNLMMFQVWWERYFG